MKEKERILFILHTSPPLHGAAKVGDFIVGIPFAESNIQSRFVTITSSKSIKEIGKFSSAKISSFVKAPSSTGFSKMIPSDMT